MISVTMYLQSIMRPVAGHGSSLSGPNASRRLDKFCNSSLPSSSCRFLRRWREFATKDPCVIITVLETAWSDLNEAHTNYTVSSKRLKFFVHRTYCRLRPLLKKKLSQL